MEAGCQVSITELCAHPLLLLPTPPHSHSLPPPFLPPWDWGLENPKFSDTKNGLPWVPQISAFSQRLTCFLLCVPLSTGLPSFPNTGPRPLGEAGRLLSEEGTPADTQAGSRRAGMLQQHHNWPVCPLPMHHTTPCSPQPFHRPAAAADGAERPNQDSSPDLTPKPRYAHPTLSQSSGSPGDTPSRGQQGSL